jgi:hypothetical protein
VLAGEGLDEDLHASNMKILTLLLFPLNVKPILAGINFLDSRLYPP